MTDRVPTRPEDASTVIGPDASFKGELTFENGLRIEGRFEGHIRTKGAVAIAGKGKVKGEIEAAQVLVEGDVEGNLTGAERVELRGTAKIRGDLRAAKLLVAEGAVLSGQCHIGPDSAQSKGPAGPERVPEREILPTRPDARIEMPIRK